MFRVLGIFFLCLFVAGLAFCIGAYLGLVKSVGQLDKPQSVESHPTYIYSAPLGGDDGPRRVIGTIFQGENRKTASLDEMPPNLLNALVAKEDERFREHGGVDLWGIMRALWVDFRAGKKVEGASTITQQYVKNAYLNQNQTWTRKIKEALIAVEIERSTYKNKDQILADYLNTVYFGSNAYGVEAAAETYFNKSVDDLTTGESAALIGILWSPSTLGSDRDAATEQRDLVLKKMFDAGYLTQQDRDKALDEQLPKEWPVAPMVESGLTGPQLTRNFTELVQQELIDKYGSTTVLNGGMSVYTTLDLKAQVAAQDTIYGPNGYLPSPDDPDAALVSIEPKTGQIKAMVGNRDQSSHFNLVTQAQRQPGSSFKPFALIAALEQGIDPMTQFVSEKKVYEVPNGSGGTERWKVENFGKKERGPISIEEALWQSDNTVFTDLAMNTDGKGLKNGPESIARVANKLGITADFGKHPHPSIVLGAKEVSPLDMATAYATIANGGKRIEPTAITKVVEQEGQKDEKVLFTAGKPKGKQVIDPKVAAKATEIMMGDITNGIAGRAALPDRPVAGKTGTSENFFDAWFEGFTPQLATGVWMGYGEGGATLQELLDPLEGSMYGQVGSPTEIWHDYMLEVMDGKPVEQFKGVDSTTAANTVNAANGTTEIQTGTSTGTVTEAPADTGTTSTTQP
ncbi:MAG TPA: transglycosylase domain-containing protein [Rubrobacteraceae bacterium]|nr:transglycosylase domain-containing protein [Rubrobacteraceae bacterium]